MLKKSSLWFCFVSKECLPKTSSHMIVTYEVNKHYLCFFVYQVLRTTMGNKVCTTSTKSQATPKRPYRTGELDDAERQAMHVLDASNQVMDKHLDGICANLETLQSNLEQIKHEIQEQTSIVAKVGR